MQTNYILIAEDDEDDRFLLTSAFREIGNNLSITFVTNGIELIDHFIRIESNQVN